MFSQQDNSQRNLFLKKYSVLLSSLIKDIQSVLWCCFNGGLKYFSIFSLPVLKPLAYEEVENRFAALLNFLRREKLVIPSMVSKWEAELMVFHRTVIQPLDLSLLSMTDTSTFWIDSNSFAQFPNLHHFWNIMCCLGFDATDSHSFEEETFKSHICVLPEDFQLGVEVIRLYRHSWRDRSTDNQGVGTIPSEVKTRIDQVSDIIQARKKDFGDHYLDICKARKKL